MLSLVRNALLIGVKAVIRGSRAGWLVIQRNGNQVQTRSGNDVTLSR